MINYLSLNTYQQVTYIFEYAQLIVAVIGIIGNIFVFIVFSRPNLRKHSYSFYCRAMAISDICLLMNCFKNWTAYIFDANLDIVSPFFCSISVFILYVIGGQSLTLLTLITADRMLTIVYMNRFDFLKKRWFQWLMVFIGLVYNISINLLSLINNHIVEVNQSTNVSEASIKVCTIDPEISFKQTWISLANFFLLVVIINNVLNIKIILYMVSSRRKVARNLNHPLQKTNSRDRKFAITSIGLNLACLVIKSPFVILLIVVNEVALDYDVFIAIQSVVLTIGLLENGFSFFINFFINSIFHDEFLVLIGLRKPNLNLASSIETVSGVNSQKRKNTESRPYFY